MTSEVLEQSTVGLSEKDLTLVTLSIDSVDTVNRTVSGMAPPTTTFNVDTDVCPGGCGTFVSAYPVTSNGAGQWVADFAAHGVTAFVPGNDIGANISDGDGDNTIYDVSVPNPRFEASVYQGSGVDGCEFAPNSSVSVTVKSGPAGTTLASGSASTDGDGCFGFDFNNSNCSRANC